MKRTLSFSALLLTAFHIASTAALLTVTINLELDRRSGRQTTATAMRLLAISICGLPAPAIR